MTRTADGLFPDMEVIINDNLTAWTVIRCALPRGQEKIISAMSKGSNLIQVYCPRRQISLWDMTGLDGIIPHRASVRALIRKNLIMATTSDKEWEVQIALGTADERVWEINPIVFESLQNSICVIRTIKKCLLAGGKFNNANAKTDNHN